MDSGSKVSGLESGVETFGVVSKNVSSFAWTGVFSDSDISGVALS